MNTKPFGYSYLFDMYGVPSHNCDDLELHYRFLEELVDALEMNLTAPPVGFHGPRVRGVELYPDKAGVSAWVPLIESGIQIHSVAPSNFITLDVYSCKEFQSSTVDQVAQKYFLYEYGEGIMLVRGEKYGTWDSSGESEA